MIYQIDYSNGMAPGMLLVSARDKAHALTLATEFLARKDVLDDNPDFGLGDVAEFDTDTPQVFGIENIN